MNDEEEKAVVMYLITNHKTTAGELMSFVQITLDNFYRLKLDSVEGMMSNGKLLAEKTARYFRRFLRSTAFYFR